MFKNIIIIILGSILLFQNYHHKTNVAQPTQPKKLADGVAVVKTVNVTKLDTSKIESVVVKEIKSNKETIKTTGTIKTSAKGKFQNRANDAGKLAKRYNVKKKVLMWSNGYLNMPIGVALYSPKKESRGKDPWITKAFDIEFSYEVTRTNRNGVKRTYVSAFAKPKNLKGYDKAWFPLDIDPKGTIFQEIDESEYQFDWWKPIFSIGASMDAVNTNLAIKMNFMYYGKNEIIHEYQFLSPMIEIDNVGAVEPLIELVSYNIGEVLPFISDIHAGIATNANGKIKFEITSVF